VSKKQHIATYPLYGSHPISLRVDTSNRIGTGYIYSVDEIPKIQERLDKYGHPLRLRWRNEECRRRAVPSANGQPT
jgi:hypothetical protein